MSLKAVVKVSINKHHSVLLRTPGYIAPDEEHVILLSEQIAADLAEFLRPEIMRLLVTMVPMEHMDSFIDDRINHLLEE